MNAVVCWSAPVYFVTGFMFFLCVENVTVHAQRLAIVFHFCEIWLSWVFSFNEIDRLERLTFVEWDELIQWVLHYMTVKQRRYFDNHTNDFTWNFVKLVFIRVITMWDFYSVYLVFLVLAVFNNDLLQNRGILLHSVQMSWWLLLIVAFTWLFWQLNPRHLAVI